ncbi:hypothetical protein [Bacillus sp. FJAT-47783]|uniref:hypothetical protein n=1 Tax=Bacillus sp. FJAT-47783 TaxID=2922712 RepID=UPI001FABE834|nr:hypothetical protein [Bacillus sp. FJAT-47783]
MLRTVISSVVSIAIVYFVLVFVYDNFPEVRPMMNDAKNAVLYVYNYAVARWGTVAVGGLIIFAIFALAKR